MKLGSPKFDGVAVMEMTVSFMGPTVSLQAKAAFVNSKTGHTHGSTTCLQWSPETIQLLGALRDRMEEDLVQVHFSEGLESSSDEAVSPLAKVLKKHSGIGERLNDDMDVPPID